MPERFTLVDLVKMHHNRPDGGCVMGDPLRSFARILVQDKTTFFEEQVSEYSLRGVGQELKHEFNLDTSF